MYGSIKKLINDINEKVDPEGNVEVYYSEPEYPYYFELEPTFTCERNSNLAKIWLVPDLLKRGQCVGGRLKIHLKKSGRPVILDTYLAINYSDELEVDVIRNDLDWPIEIVLAFGHLCIAKANVIKSEKNLLHFPRKTVRMYDYKSTNQLLVEYEKVRANTKKVWNKYMKTENDD